MNVTKFRREKSSGPQNILHSLEYLAKEAESNNDIELSHIIKSAIIIYTTHPVETLDDISDIANDEDILTAAFFLVKFFKASSEVQRAVISTIENKQKNLNE